MTSLWPVGDGRSWWASEKPLRDAGSGQGKPTEDLGSKDLLLPKEAAESTPRPGKFSCPQRPAPSMQARGETATSDHLEPFLFVRKWTLRGGASLSNAAKCRVGKHLLRDRSPLHMACRQRQRKPKAAKTSGRAVPHLAAGPVDGNELQTLAVRARRCIRRSIPAPRGGALRTTVVSTRLTKGNCGGDQIA